MLCIVPAGAGAFCCTFTTILELSVRLCHCPSLLYWDGFPAKLTAKEGLRSALQSFFALHPVRVRLPWWAGILCACTWVLFRFQQLKFCGTAMVLGGRSQEPVYPSVVPLRSYSSLNLQQVASCDFYLYSLTGSSSSKPQTTAQKSNHLHEHSRHCIALLLGNGDMPIHNKSLILPSERPGRKYLMEEFMWFLYSLDISSFFPFCLLNFAKALVWSWSNAGFVASLQKCTAIMDEQIVLCPTEMGPRDCMAAPKQERPGSSPLSSGPERTRKKLQKKEAEHWQLV